MATMTRRETADFRLRACLGWGFALLAVALVLWWLRDLYSADSGGSDSESATYAVLALVALLPGAVLSLVGLVAVGVRLGLVAHGVEPRD